jgi:DNA modification methylase
MSTEPTRVQIIQADTRTLPLADDSVDLIVTSPPYFGLRSYTDGGEHYDGQIGAEPTPTEYVDALIAATREWLRVLKPEGSLWINLGDKYCTYEGPRNVPQNSKAGLRQGAASQESVRHTKSAPGVYGVPYKSLLGLPWRYALRCIDELGLALRAEVIWDKPNGMPESATDRVRRSHEQWFHFAQQQRYYADVDQIRDAPSGYSRPLVATREARGGQRPRLMRDTCNPKGRLPGSVWEIATTPLKVPEEIGTDHYAAFPIEWPLRIIAAWSPPGGVVLDPFGGTGTTALAADILGRTGISVDASADYCRIAAWRTTDPGERARAMRVPKPEPELEGQLSLLDELEAAA